MNRIYKFLFINFSIVMLFFNLAQAQIQVSKPTLVFATTLYYMPFAALDSKGYMHGFSISFTRTLCDIMQVNCIYKPMTFVDMFASLKNKEVDAAVGSIAITPDRQAEFAFTLPYLPSRASFVGRKLENKPLVSEINAEVLQGKIIGSQEGSVFVVDIMGNYPDVPIRYYKGFHELIEALSTGEVDFILTDAGVANYWVNNTNLFYTIGNYIPSNYGIGIMLNKENTELQAKLNAAIREFTQDPEFAELVLVFFFPFSS